MQDYIALRVNAEPCSETITDLLAAFLGDIGYESFTPDERGVTAFIQSQLYDAKAVEEIIEEFPLESKFNISTELVKGEDWNEEWEKNYFKPIVIGNEVVVHSSFHKDIPEALYDIVIDPKMAFGTGHHATTSQMMRFILDADLKGKSVIDMGTGTGILAILCAMKGAKEVYGVEIDPFAFENAVENVALNNVAASMACGDADALKDLPDCDVFLANINRNVITGDIQKYAAKLKTGGIMFLSGFYEHDVPVVEKAAEPYSLIIDKTTVDTDWAAVRLVKSN